MKSYKLIFIILLSLFACNTEKSPVTPEVGPGDDYKIYQLALDAYFNENVPAIILQDSTWGDDIGTHHISTLEENGVNVKEETLLNYETINQTKVALESISGYDITFRRDVPDSLRFSKPNVSLSRVGYDDANTEAIVTVGVVFAPLAGSGILYYLKYVNGEWGVKGSHMIWIS